MKNRKCNNCGASVDIEVGEKCKYCGSVFVKPEEDRPIVINNYYTVEKDSGKTVEHKKNRSTRNPYVEEETLQEKNDPEINILLCVFLFLISPIAGGIYLAYKIYKLHERRHEDDE